MLLENLWPGAETHMQIITSIFFEIFLDQHTDELVCKQRRRRHRLPSGLVCHSSLQSLEPHKVNET